MSKRQNRRSVSVSPTGYWRLCELALQCGESKSGIVEQLISDLADSRNIRTPTHDFAVAENAKRIVEGKSRQPPATVSADQVGGERCRG